MFLILIAAWPAAARAQQIADADWRGRSVAEVLDTVRASGFPVVYSTRLVSPDLRIEHEPVAREPALRVAEILAPHGLALEPVDGLFVVTRTAPAGEQRPPQAQVFVILERPGSPPGDLLVQIRDGPRSPAARKVSTGIYAFDALAPGRYRLEVRATGYLTAEHAVNLGGGLTHVWRVEINTAPAELATLDVSASRYVLFSSSPFFIDQRAIQSLPDLGEDPLRSVQRLPGTAAGGLSSRSHFRGGAEDETAIYLNGLHLLDPFHIRDYHSIFSTIDARAIAGIEAWTGGFPARYGDSMSGVLLLQSQQPDEPRHTELGLSVYNTSALVSGYSENETVDWLLSARRSNLDLVLSDDLGKPDYFDSFAAAGWNVSAQTRLSINGLYADDRVTVITESDPEELERSDSRTRNRHVWLLAETDWSPTLSSATVLSVSRLENRREAEVNDPEQLVGAVLDERSASLAALRQDWRLVLPGGLEFNAGLEMERMSARYDYRSEASYFEFFAAWPGITNPRTAALRADPSGHAFGAFASLRWRLAPNTTVEPGLRWDRQTYTGSADGSQLSPRLAMRHEFPNGLDLRLSWGRYHQAQPIQNLQIEDGITRFFAPQRSDHWIAGLQRRWPNGYRLRLEAFFKDYERLKPRFENLYDDLALIPELEPDRVRLDPASARARGVELTLEYRGDGPLNGWASWTWSRVSDTFDGRREPRSWDQRHALQAGLAWDRNPWEVGLAVSVHSGWPTTGMSLGLDPDTDAYFPVPGPRNAERLGTYATLDFRIAREFRLRRGSLTAFLEVSNATNRKNACCVDFDIDEDDEGQVFLDRTEDHWLPILPAIGLLWVF
ncbi:TonB-dependent receptor [Elongatibacter sediminis]|uniref:TonB-dependent receptor n=1 Tax=Elongatibacter sediminis TaxID=3119006 RepID=A0AAW9RK74_9GAMM